MISFYFLSYKKAFGLLGINGAGKSTTLNILTGVCKKLYFLILF